MPTRKIIFGGADPPSLDAPAAPASPAAPAAPSAPEELSIKGDLNKIEQLLNSIRYSTPVLFLWTHKLYLILVVVWLSVLFFGGPSEDIDEEERGFLGWGDCDFDSDCNGNLECGRGNCGNFKVGGERQGKRWFANPLATKLVEDDSDCCCLKDDTDGDGATCNEKPLLAGEGDCENYTLGMGTSLRGDTCDTGLECGNNNCVNFAEKTDVNHKYWMNYAKLIDDEADCCCSEDDPTCEPPEEDGGGGGLFTIGVGGQCNSLDDICDGELQCGNSNCGRFGGEGYGEDSDLDCCCDTTIPGQCDSVDTRISCDGVRDMGTFNYSVSGEYDCVSWGDNKLFKEGTTLLLSNNNLTSAYFKGICCEDRNTCPESLCTSGDNDMTPINSAEPISCDNSVCTITECCDVKTCDGHVCTGNTVNIGGTGGTNSCLTSGCDNCCDVKTCDSHNCPPDTEKIGGITECSTSDCANCCQ